LYRKARSWCIMSMLAPYTPTVALSFIHVGAPRVFNYFSPFFIPFCAALSRVVVK
jgi:hypothetical protein